MSTKVTNNTYPLCDMKQGDRFRFKEGRGRKVYEMTNDICYRPVSPVNGAVEYTASARVVSKGDQTPVIWLRSVKG